MRGPTLLRRIFLSALLELVEELARGSGHRHARKSVDDELSLALIGDEIGLLEDREMAGDGWLRQSKPVDDLSDCMLSGLEKTENLSSGLIRERLEELVQEAAIGFGSGLDRNRWTEP